MKWEQVDDYTQRAVVYGGWVLKISESVYHDTPERGMIDGWDWRIAITFIPDPNHEWEINEGAE